MSERYEPGDRREAAIAEALRDFIDHLEIQPNRDDSTGRESHSSTPASCADSHVRRVEGTGRGLRSTLFAIAASLALVAVALFAVPRTVPTQATVPPADVPITLPTELRGYRLFNTPLAWSPVGRALMTYVDTGDDETFLDRRQTMVLGSDMTSYRSLGIADDRNRNFSSAPVEISPDGSRLAVGSPAWGSDILVIESATGRHSSVHLTNAQHRELDPVTWSPDGRVLFVLDRPSTGSWPPSPGQLLRVEVDAGTARPLTGLNDVLTVSSSDDPSSLLVGRRDAVQIVDSQTGAVRETITNIPPTQLHSNAWSPDGRSIIASHVSPNGSRPQDHRLTLFTRENSGPWQPRRLPLPHDGVLGALQDGDMAWFDQHSILFATWNSTMGVLDLRSGAIQLASAREEDTLRSHSVRFARHLVRDLDLTLRPWPNAG